MPEDYTKLTVVVLRGLLKERSIPATGLTRKQQIVDRLLEWDEEMANSRDEERPSLEAEVAPIDRGGQAYPMEEEEEEKEEMKEEELESSSLQPEIVVSVEVGREKEEMEERKEEQTESQNQQPDTAVPMDVEEEEAAKATTELPSPSSPSPERSSTPDQPVPEPMVGQREHMVVANNAADAHPPSFEDISLAHPEPAMASIHTEEPIQNSPRLTNGQSSSSPQPEFLKEERNDLGHVAEGRTGSAQSQSEIQITGQAVVFPSEETPIAGTQAPANDNTTPHSNDKTHGAANLLIHVDHNRPAAEPVTTQDFEIPTKEIAQSELQLQSTAEHGPRSSKFDERERKHARSPTSSPHRPNKKRPPGESPLKSPDNALLLSHSGVPPAQHIPTPCLYISNLMRPLQVPVLRQHLLSLLSQSPTPSLSTSAENVVPVSSIKVLYIDSVRTHAFAILESTEMAVRARNRLHNTIFPQERGRRPVLVDFVPEAKAREWIRQEEEAKAQGSERFEVVYEREGGADDGPMVARLVQLANKAGDKEKSNVENGCDVAQASSFLPSERPGFSHRPSRSRSETPSSRRSRSRSARRRPDSPPYSRPRSPQGLSFQGGRCAQPLPHSPPPPLSNPERTREPQPRHRDPNPESFVTLDTLFRSTRSSKPVLYHIPVSTSLARKRKAQFRKFEGRSGRSFFYPDHHLSHSHDRDRNRNGGKDDGLLHKYTFEGSKLTKGRTLGERGGGERRPPVRGQPQGGRHRRRRGGGFGGDSWRRED